MSKGVCREDESAWDELLVEELLKQLGENLGAKYIEENNKLKNDPDAKVPDDVRRRCLKRIEDSFK